MSLLAAIDIGGFCALLVGVLLGRPLSRGRWTRAKAGISGSQLWLTQAGVALSTRQFVVGSVAVAAVTFAVATLVTGAPLVAVVPAFAVATLPRAYFGRRRAAR
ncbi:MAG: hypothetical protein ACHQDE_00850, partial [Acidimicrobiia bacterium]